MTPKMQRSVSRAIRRAIKAYEHECGVSLSGKAEINSLSVAMEFSNGNTNYCVLVGFNEAGNEDQCLTAMVDFVPHEADAAYLNNLALQAITKKFF